MYTKLIILNLGIFCILFSIPCFGQSKSELIRIETADLSLIFTSSLNEKVVFQYFGERLEGDCSTYFTDRQFKGRSDTHPSFLPEIYPAYGGRNFLEPSLSLVHEDGVFTTDLVYMGFERKQIDKNVTETIIKLKDKLYPVFVSIHFKAFEAENIISQWVEINHNEKKDIRVKNIASSYIPLHKQFYYLTHFTGTWAAEMQLVEEKLTPGIKRIESKKGIRTTQSESPLFLLSVDGPARENDGEIYAGALAWSGNYQLTFEIDECGILHFSGGLNPFLSEYCLSPKQSFSTPQMILSYSSEGKGQISRNFHRWCRKYSLAHGEELRPIVLNSWEGAYFNYKESDIIQMIDRAADFGIEMFVLDDGWFGSKYPRNSDKAGLGDWTTNLNKLPHGIDYLAKHAADKGLKFGIWIEPEMVNPDSELAHKHPEWIVKSGNREVQPMRNQLLLDMTNPEVQDFVIKTFDKIMALSSEISYVKWDANRHANNVGSKYLDDDRQTHFWIEYVKGLYRTYNSIRKKYPDVMIQLCASGGGRLDFGALFYHDEFWASDNTNPLNRIFIQSATSLFFPAIATASHVSTSPNHQTGMLSPLKYRFDVSMSGRLGMELQPRDIKGTDLDFAKKAIETYKQIRPIVQFGDLYRLLFPYEGGSWASHMYVSSDKREAVLFAYTLKYSERTKYLEIKLNGLDKTRKYKIVEVNMLGRKHFWGNDHIFSGEELMSIGIIIDFAEAFESAVFILSEI